MNTYEENERTYYYGIDFLRGMLAIFVASYHYMSWQNLFNIDSGSGIIYRFALYAISIFFIISGFAMFITYKNKNFRHRCEVIIYIRNRIARIYPLFFLVIFLAIILGYREVSSIRHLFVELSITFAFFNNYGGLTPGSWSIGVEIVFYMLFPAIVLFGNVLSKSFFSVILIIFIIYFLIFSAYANGYANEYANKYINARYFRVYVENFSNHFYFFLMGILVAMHIDWVIKYLRKKYIAYIIALISILLFISIRTDSIYYSSLVDEYRIIFSFLSLMIFIPFLLVRGNWLFKFFGNISYAVYLLHPLIYYLLFRYIEDMSYIIYLFFVILSASFVYYYYEVPMRILVKDFKVCSYEK